MDISKCETCKEDCPQAQSRHEAATGRMYAMRELAKCAPYWDALFDENQKPKITPDRLRELVETDREGRIKILPKPGANTCGSCGHFHRIAGTSCGTCDEQAYYKSHRGEIDPGRGTFSPSQSRKACRKYNPAAEGEQ